MHVDQNNIYPCVTLYTSVYVQLFHHDHITIVYSLIYMQSINAFPASPLLKAALSVVYREY